MQKIAVWYAILAIMASGQVGGMTLTLKQRQQGAATTAIEGGAAAEEAGAVAMTSVAVNAGVTSTPAVQTITTYPPSSSSAASAPTSASASVSETSRAADASSASSHSSGASASSHASSTSGQSASNASSATSASSSSSPSASASSAPEKLVNPSNRPAPAPGGMAFILPAFVIIGCIFIVWLIHNLRIYLYKIKEVEEADDTQSPDPANDKGQGSGGYNNNRGSLERGEKMMRHGERRWRKKGWKELGSGDDYTDEEAGGRYAYRERSGRGGDADEKGMYRLERRYEDEEVYRDERGRAHAHAHRRRAGDGEGQDRYDKYSRTDDWQGSRKYKQRQTTRTKSKSSSRPGEGAGSQANREEKGRSGARDVERRRSTRPGKSSSDTRDADAAKTIQGDVDLGAGNTAGHDHEDHHRHAYDRRELERYRRAPDAYEDEFDERYLDLLSMPAAEAAQQLQQMQQLQVQLGPHQYRTASRDGTPNIPSASRVPPGVKSPPNPKLTVEAPTPIDSHFPRSHGQQEPPHQQQRQQTLQGEGTRYVLGEAEDTPKRKHTARHAPLNLRARAISPPPVLSPPMNPTLFFHNGPSVTNLNALAIGAISTDGSSTDISSIAGYADRGDGREKEGISGGVEMPTIPSSADKLGSFDTSADAGAAITSRTGQAGAAVLETPRAKTIRRVGADPPRRQTADSPQHTPTAARRSARKAVPSSTPGAHLEKRASRKGTTPAPSGSPTASPAARGTLSAATLRRAAMRELQERAKAQADSRSGADDPRAAEQGRSQVSSGTERSDSTGSKSSVRPKSRVSKKEEKARGKVQEILRESWSERAVVGSVVPISGLADQGSDDDQESEGDTQGEGQGRRKEHKDEVEMYRHQKAHADIAASAAAEGRRSRAASPAHTRPLSPRYVPLPAGGVASPDGEDVGRLQGIEERFAMM